MRSASSPGPTAAGLARLWRLWPIFTSFALTAAFTFDPVSVPDLDLSQLGRVGLAGDFDAISLYTYTEQNEDGISTNGSSAVITSLPNGDFANLAVADASIEAMCSFVMKGGTMAGVVVGGNFTSLGGVEAQGVAMVDPKSGKVSPLPGLSGKVQSLFCDQDTNTVYVGGQFKGAASTNAIGWVGMSGWANLPFAGFNGPVSTIAKAPNGNIVFGGSFDGLGNSTTPQLKDQQDINLSTANISAVASAVTQGFSDPKNIICKTDGQSGPGNTWLLADNSPGSWRADFSYGFEPTKLRLWNTNQDGRGTKTFRFTAFPINGILNFTYVDPATGQNATCDAQCPLSNNASAPFQDFTFVNVIGMSSFQIDISDWYGSGAGLDGIQLLQNDIFAYAVNDFNEPSCANTSFPSNATSTGPWTIMPSGQSSSEYLSATFSGGNVDANSASVVFSPDIKQSGNYSVTIYTPGCTQDNTCANRGRVNITGTMASITRVVPPVQTEISQTNNFDKYDQVYSGYVEAGSDNFRPTVTLTPSSGQAAGLEIVAQRVRFELIASTGGLNGLYEFNPNQVVTNTDFSNSSIDQAGMNLDVGAAIASVVVGSNVTYVAGNFSTSSFQNIFAIDGDNNATALPSGGLNDAVFNMYLNGSSLYVGGNFSNTEKNDTNGLSNVALYSIDDQTWKPLGAGLDGQVTNIIPVTVNVTANQPEDVVAFTGNFTTVLAFDTNPAAPVDGLAVWVPSKNNWIQVYGSQTPSINGQLVASVRVPNGPTLYAGTLSAHGQTANDAVTLATSGGLAINGLPTNIQTQQVLPNVQKRDLATNATASNSTAANVTGVVTGFFHVNNNVNVTILGGHFSAKASNGSTINNLMFINGTNNDEMTGITTGVDDSSVFLALTTQQDTLYAGGVVTGNVSGGSVNGLILYDLVGGNYASTQPPAFGGDDVVVTAITTQPNTGNVYVGGTFETAGSLDCPAVCYYSTQSAQWNRPGTGLDGSVGAMTWSQDSKLLVGGNLTVNSTATTVATYDANLRVWSMVQGADAIPGPVTALSPADDAVSTFWVSGASPNGSTFLMKYDGSSWHSVDNLLGNGSTILGLQVLSLATNHDDSDLVSADQTLLITGQLNLPNFGNASSAVYNGSTLTPFILSNSGNEPGTLSQIFSQNPISFESSGGHLAVGFVVLIALAISLALIFILVVIGIIAERIRRQREGYMPAPTQMFDKNSNMDRIPPSHLFGNLGHPNQGPGGAPMI